MNHVVTIHPNPHADNSRFKFENVCTCQWQMLCMSLEIADSHATAHLSYHGSKEAIVKKISPAPAPSPTEPRPAYHPEGSLPPKVSAKASPKAPDAP